MLEQLKKKKALESLKKNDSSRSPASERSEDFRKAANEQYIRYNQEIGTSPHSSSYNGDVIGQGRLNELNQKVMMPVIEKHFKNPEEYILQSEEFLQNISEEEKRKMRETRPEVVDPKKNALEALKKSRLS